MMEQHGIEEPTEDEVGISWQELEITDLVDERDEGFR